MAGMDERRNDGGGIVVGCLIFVLFFVVLAIGASAWLFYVRTQAQIQVQEEAATRAVEAARQAQMSAVADAEKAALQQETAHPEAK
jgi:uncharacterized protein HemX